MSFSKEVEQAVAVGYGIGINVVDEKCTLKFEEALRKADELSTAIGEFFREYAKATHVPGGRKPNAIGLPFDEYPLLRQIDLSIQRLYGIRPMQGHKPARS